MSSPRILFVYQFLTLGGVEVVMQTRLGELARRGIEARALFLGRSAGGESIFKEMSDRIDVCTEDAKIERYLTDFNPDWISTIDTPAIVPIAHRVVPQARIAYEVHTPYPAFYAPLLDPDLFEGVSGILVPSQSQKEFIALRMARPLTIEVVPNSIPEAFFRQKLQSDPPKRNIVMWVGRLDVEKNWRGFVELAARVRESINAEFWLVGGLRNQEEMNLFEATRRAGLIGSFRWLPAVNYEDMPRLYSLVGRSGGCLVSTSWGESFGMAALEAMASRCPVIAPDVVGLRDIVKHGQTGWLYPPMSIARARDFILESFQDLHARQIIIENAQHQARGFTTAATVDKLLEVFAEWSANAPPKGATLGFERKRLVNQLRIAAESLAAKVAERGPLGTSLSQQLNEQRQVIESLRAEVSGKQAELSKITGSLGWRLLSRYGRIKYRYLLPVYRLLGLDRSSTHRASSAAELEGVSSQFRMVIRRVRDSKGAVIFLPSVGWRIHLTQRPHHLARELARQGYLAVFDCSNSHDDVDGFKEIEPNLFLFKGPERLLHQIPDPILWAFTYNYHHIKGYSPSARVVYDLIDDLDVFPHDRGMLQTNHVKALKEAVVVASVAQRLHQEVIKARPDALYLPNAVEYELFADTAATMPDDPDIEALLKQDKPIVGYYGALADWFDYELVNDVAQLREDWNFLLIGPEYDSGIHRRGQDMLNRANVFWIGPREYSVLPRYLQLFDVATIPFLINRITLATSPLKLYEYFSAGKPVITTPIPECQAFPEVHIVRNAQEFSQALDVIRAQGKQSESSERLRRLGRENSWTTRVECIMEHLKKGDARIDGENPWASPIKSEADEEAQGPIYSGNPTEGIARRFAHCRMRDNERFFDSLADYLSPLSSSPCLPMYFEFAITTNERGRQVANLLAKYRRLKGKRYLDVGCAYGGFLIAFAEKGADVTGIDVNEKLLDLARQNFLDKGISAPLLLKDATNARDLAEMRGQFDLITCNDVIEHVPDPAGLVVNIAGMLHEEGITYFEIPNGKFPRFVLKDGHYQLFGITLLDYDDANKYYQCQGHSGSCDTYNYLEISQYAEIFERAEIHLEVLDESFAGADVRTILNDLAELRAQAISAIEQVPEPLREKVAESLSNYLEEIESFPRSTESERREFMLRYGASFWRVLGRKATKKD